MLSNEGILILTVPNINRSINLLRRLGLNEVIYGS